MEIRKRMTQVAGRMKNWLMEYAYLVTLGAVVAVVAASAMYANRIKLEREEALRAAAGAAEISATEAPAAVSPLPTIAPMVFSQTTFAPRRVTVWPASGKIVRAYERGPVLWEALGALKSHEAIDIAGQAQESVRCAMDGVVALAVMDELWGWRVHVAHTDGSEGRYAGLGLSFVSEGQSVTRGQELGTLLESIPCEAELGPHLHFEWISGGVKQDPEGLLPE